MYALRHAGQIDAEGKLILSDPSAWRSALARHRGRHVWITVVRQQQIRSTNQSRYYWGVVVRDIADHCGEARETMHEYLKALHLPTREIELLDGQKVSGLPATTTTLTVEQFSEYVERCRTWAAQFLGLSIPSPGEVEAL